MLQRGDQVPHFDTRTLQGERFSYSTLWQHANLVLVSLAGLDQGETEPYVADLMKLVSEFSARNTGCVVTRDPVPPMPSPGAVVADRWGEIVHVSAASDVSELPSPRELLDWVDYVQGRCPECEGEAK